MSEVAARRLAAQRLVGEPFASPADAVRAFGAVQAQDYGGAKWALGLRTAGVTEADVDRLFDEGAILRTHVMRPTWHFVLPEDARWLLELTAPRLHAWLAPRRRQLELDADTLARAEKAFAKAAADGGALTRAEFGAALSEAGISPEGQRLPHLLLAAELDRVLISGPRRGRQQTWAPFDARVPPSPTRDREDALAELARRYFRSHGPATIHDFAWWSGLTVADARRAAHLAGDDLNAAPPQRTATGVAHLLPNFDEYTVAYRDRSAALDPAHPHDPSLFSFGSILGNALAIDGRIRGAWKRTLRPKAVSVELRLSEPLTDEEAAAVRAAADRYGRFLGRPAALGQG